MKKKFLSILMACALLAGILSGCGGNPSTPSDSGSSSGSSSVFRRSQNDPAGPREPRQ